MPEPTVERIDKQLVYIGRRDEFFHECRQRGINPGKQIFISERRGEENKLRGIRKDKVIIIQADTSAFPDDHLLEIGHHLEMIASTP